MERIIGSDEDLQEGLHFLEKHDPVLKKAIDEGQKIVLISRNVGFSALLKTIVSQQLSTAAAATIWQKIVDSNLQNQEHILQAKDETLLSLGLSRQKCSYARALALENLDYKSLDTMSSDQVISRLIEVKGIGKWTAQIYCMFSLARADIFPSGDLALQEAIKVLYRLNKRPSEKEVEKKASQLTFT